jgi:hypothetical protein
VQSITAREMAALRSALPSPRKQKGEKLKQELGVKAGKFDGGGQREVCRFSNSSSRSLLAPYRGRKRWAQEGEGVGTSSSSSSSRDGSIVVCAA